MMNRKAPKRSIKARSGKALRNREVEREDRRDSDYEVGFGKPLKRTRFKPGVSGNPKGRPKWKTKGMLTDMVGKELYRPLRISQNGETTEMPALQLALRRLVRMGAEGNPKAVQTLLGIADEHSEAVAEEQMTAISAMTEDERLERIKMLLERGARRKKAQEEKDRLRRGDKRPKKQ